MANHRALTISKTFEQANFAGKTYNQQNGTTGKGYIFVLCCILFNIWILIGNILLTTFETDENDRGRARSRFICPIVDCPFANADSIPTQAIILDMFTEEDKNHIELFHPEC